jgi:hypothetical protein
MKAHACIPARTILNSRPALLQRDNLVLQHGDVLTDLMLDGGRLSTSAVPPTT